MLDKLKDILQPGILEALLADNIIKGKVKSMYIDYHEPFVNRVWFEHEDIRVYFHKIETCTSSIDALFHPHKWDSAMYIAKGSYEMGIGHSSTDDIPKIDTKIILPKKSMYEMTEPDGWHYVNPINEPSYTLMITGKLNGRKMPIEPNKEFRKLRLIEIEDVLHWISKADNFHLIN